MHDVHIAAAIVDHLTRSLGSEGLKRVTRVRIRADAVLEPASLRQAYEMLTTSGPLQGSRLEVETISRSCTCPRCASSWAPTSEDAEGHLLLCPTCGAPSPVDDAGAIELVEVVGPSG
ncbi:MAG TPA: hydrogenase maturation nickel metallochaperone HypA [Actinomycetota bacterium]|nr:hydrogenase maturation nickel metallochaperone HypA [Actinomycetota bacterium]